MTLDLGRARCPQRAATQVASSTSSLVLDVRRQLQAAHRNFQLRICNCQFQIAPRVSPSPTCPSFTHHVSRFTLHSPLSTLNSPLSTNFLASLCLLLALSFSAQPAEGIRAGEEFPLLADGPGHGLQGTPAVSFGRNIYMAVWREGWHGKGGSARILAARISPTGSVLDPKGLALAPAQSGVQERPRVAFGGGTFLVVWQDFRNGKDYDILAARLSPAGEVLDREPITVAGGPHNQVLPDVASDGRNFLVVWQGFGEDVTNYQGFAAAVSADGKVGPSLKTGMTPQPKVAWSGADYLAASGGAGFWQGNVQTVRLAADGTAQGKPVLAIRGTKAAIFSLSAVPGTGWLVVSHRSPPDPWGWGGPGAMRAVLINGAGQPENQDGVKEPAGVQDRLPGWLDLGKARKPGATWPWGESAGAFDGKHSVIVWPRHHLCGEKFTEFQNADLVAARLEGYRPLDMEGVPVAAGPLDELRPALAGAGDGRLLLLYEKQLSDGRVNVVGRMLQTEP